MDPKDCIFCRIVKNEIPSKKVYEDGVSFAFLDINPRNPGHTLVIPKRHYETIFDIPEERAGEFFESVKRVAGMVKNGTKAQGLNITQSNGSAAGQIVSHLHFHVIPRFANEGPVAPEGILQVKKMDEKSMDKVVGAIKSASSEGGKTIREEEPEEEERPAKKEKGKKKEGPEEEEGEFEDIEEFEFE